ncbi:MAG: acyl-CoA dehydratase activase, partial [Armatimonadota bacterium]
TCNAVVIDDACRLLGASTVVTGARGRAAAEAALRAVLDEIGISSDALTALVSTGYGRDIVDQRAASVTEITCHARGVAHLFPDARTVLDVGGQDFKAIRVDSGGRVVDFAMNDKCAAGTGRFFEVMARALEVDLDDLGALAGQASREIVLNHVCTVFAESEVVGMIARGEDSADIAAALCRSAAERVAFLAKSIEVIEPVVLTGGVARNEGFKRALDGLLTVSSRVPPDPQITGALGAALLASDRGAVGVHAEFSDRRRVEKTPGL